MSEQAPVDINDNDSYRAAVTRILEGIDGTGPRGYRQDVQGTTNPRSTVPDCFAFSDRDRALDCLRAFKHLIDNPEGVPLSRLAECLFGDISADERCYSSADYSWLERFCRSSDYVALNRSTDVTQASPTLDAFSLDLGKYISNSDAEPGADAPEPGEKPVSGRTSLSHKQFAESYLSRINSIGSTERARLVAKPYLRYLESIEEKYLVHERVDSPAEDYLMMPYHTRFNNQRRKDDQWRRFFYAWDEAARSYDYGLHWTLTTDPKRYDSLVDQVEGIFDAWSNLLEALNQRLDLDGRLDYVRALEWTDQGFPHLHVVTFGTKYIDYNWMAEQWSRKQDHADVVHFARLTHRGGDGGNWVHHDPEKNEKFNARAYLGEYLSESFDEIASTVKEQYQMVHDLDGERIGETETGRPIYDFHRCYVVKMALYWATGRQFWSCSHDLKEPDPDTLEEVPGVGETTLDRLADHGIRTLSDVRLTTRDELAEIDGLGETVADRLLDLAGTPSTFDTHTYEFRGAATYGNIPGQVRDSATVVGVPAVG